MQLLVRSWFFKHIYLGINNSCLVESDFQTGSNSVSSLIHSYMFVFKSYLTSYLFVFISMQSGNQNAEKKINKILLFLHSIFINHLSLSAPEFGGPAE